MKYTTSEGKVPFDDWMGGFKEAKTRARVNTAVERLEDGNFGSFRRLGEGVTELKVRFGPGYRVYFAELEGWIVVLLCGADKSAHQDRDIETARRYWQDCKRRWPHEKQTFPGFS